MYGTGVIGKGLTKAVELVPRIGATAAAAESIVTGARALTWTQRLTSIGISSASFAIYDSAKFSIDYFTGNAYSSQGIEYGEGLKSSALHSAAFGAFASFWGQAVTGNLLKLFKNPQAESIAAETLGVVNKQFKNSSKFTAKELLASYQGAQAKALGSLGKNVGK